MTVHKFNQEGVSVFTESDLVTEVHAHPTLELILALNGCFTLSNKQKEV